MAILKRFLTIYALLLPQLVYSAPEKGFTDKLKTRLLETGLNNAYPVISTDPLNKINNEFGIPRYFQDSTHFWFKIYTVYTSQESVLHDREHLSLIYGSVHEKDLPSESLNSRQKRFKKALLHLATSDKPCELCPEVLNALSNSSVKIPKDKNKRQKFFKQRAQSLRYQTGQKDMILKGLHFSYPYRKKIDEIIKLYEIPSELLALAFLESSFNLNARSRVGATGVWQFMKIIGQHFMIVTPKNDHRLNPLLSTLGAFQLLKQSRKLVGRWDLAVWSYNSGTPAVQKAQDKLGGSSMTLADMLKDYQSDRIRFASKNFYSSFLALVHALAYKDYLFHGELPDNNKIDADHIEFYVSKCSFRPTWFFSLLKNNSPKIKELNTHLRKRYHKTKYTRGTILISDRKLTQRRYFKVPHKNYTNRYTKNWRYLIKGQKCRR